MKLRRALATAAAVAVTSPVVLLSAAPAFADPEPATQTTQNQPKTYAELKKAAADAAKAYGDAVAAEAAGQEKLKAALAALGLDTHPLKAAALAKDAVAKAAEADKTAADKALADAEAKLAAAKDEAEKAEAQKALTAAKTDAKKAADAKADADAKKKAAREAWNDARVKAAQEYSLVQDAPEKALKIKEAADKAFAAADECVRVSGLTVLANGLPSKVVAGTTVDFSFTVANGTDRTLKVDPLAFVVLEERKFWNLIEVQYSNGLGWKNLDVENDVHVASIDAMKPGDRKDVKMRLTIDAAAAAGKGFAAFAGDASDQYNRCVLGPMKRYDFAVLAADSKPGEVADAKPGTVDDKDRPTPKPNPSAQGGTSAAPAGASAGQGAASATPKTATANGGLAETGSSSVLPKLALAGGAALALGAGAVFVVRRRKAGDN
ncbi:LPXTG cell wall anchor domain-containing protein [Streptomyces sp. NPDC051907]|uniref:LPXTG cell wall anchor domain-containing protein n=1 Tax=Streptomyces sp. NPDC051907 TaxID=3155284 RepID=UPI0034318AB4